MGRGSKNLSRGNRKLALANESTSLHYRMYKAGRFWLFAGVATFSLGAALLSAPSQASAATDPTATTAPATTGTDSGAAATTPTADDQATADTPATTPDTTTQPAATTDATAQDTTGATDQVAADAGQISKGSTSNVGLVSGNEGTHVNAPDGATDEPDTSGAVIKTNLFGNGLENASENSGTAGVGADSVDKANAANNRQEDGKGTYGNVYGNAVPDGGSVLKGGDDNISADPKLVHAGKDVNSKNDVLDSKITSSVITDNSDTTGIIDQINDQGAISSDSQNLQNNDVRGATLYSQSESSGIDFSVVGDGQNGVNIGIPDNLKATLKVGTWTVQDQTAVGIIVANRITGEQFQIVDSDYGTEGPYKDKYAKGQNIDGKAVYTAVVNGAIMQDIASAVTKGISGISTFAGGVGQALIGNGTSLITDNIKNVLENPLDISNALNMASTMSDVNDLVSRIGSTFTQDGSGIGVSDLVATLVDLLGVLKVDTTDFQAAYQGQIKQVNDRIDQLNEYGDKLMNEGVAVTGLADATIKTDTIDGASHDYIEVLSGSDLSTARAMTNMFKTYIEGWAQGIADALDSVFTGNQAIVQDDAQNDPYNLYRFNGKTPQEILNADIDKAKSGLSGILLQVGQPIIEAILNAMSGINNQMVQPVITSVDTWVANSLGDVISKAIDGAVGGETQTVAVPINWTDPKFVDEASGQKAAPGQFVNEVFDTKSKVYNVTNESATQIAYQNVDKTQLKQLIADHTNDANIPTEIHRYADAVSNDVNASQYDVDQAIIKMGGHIEVDNAAVVADSNLTDYKGTEGQTANDVLAEHLADTFVVKPREDTEADEQTALSKIKPVFTQSDFTIKQSAADAHQYNYVLTDTGKAKLEAAVKAIGSDYSVIAPAPATITVVDATSTTPTDDAVSYAKQAGDSTGTQVLAGTDQPNTAVAVDGKVGDPVDASQLPAKFTVTKDDGTNTTVTTYVPDTSFTHALTKDDANKTILVPYVQSGDPVVTPDKNTGTTTTTPSDDQATYNLDAIDESGTVLPGSASTNLTGKAGDPVDASKLAASYKDASGKTWYKPAADSLGSYFIKDGATIHVLYTDVDPTVKDDGGTTTTTQTGTGSFVINPDGTITFTDDKGNTLTLDPKKLGQPIIVNNYNTNNNTNNNTPNGDGTGTTGTDNGGTTTKPVTIVLPGQDGKDAGTTVTKGADGSLTFNFPDGSTQTVKPGDNETHTTPDGGSFVVNPDGTITFTDGKGNSYTVDPNNTTSGTTQPGSKITNIVLPGQNGADGKDGADQTLMIEKTPSGDVVLHFPDGTTQNVKPGDKGTLPDGTTWVVNPDGTITFTTKDGGTSTYDPSKGTTTPDNTNAGGQTTATPVDTDGDGIPDGFEVKIGTNPASVDTDGDGDTDFQEILNGTDPQDPDSNIKSLKNGGKGTDGNGNITIINNIGGGTGTNGTGTTGDGTTTTTQPVLITIPGQDGKDAGVQVTKNPDGSVTFTFPDGSTQTVKPGDNDEHANPNGGSFVVNPDGTITFTDPSGNKYTYDPSKETGAATQPGSKTTVLVIPGKNGTDGQNTPDQIVTVEKGENGDVTLHFPDGTTQTVKPGDEGTLPDGTKWIVNPDGTITFTTPEGKTYTIDPDKGTTNNVTINTTNGGSTTGNGADADGDGIPDNFEGVIGTNPSNKDTDGDGDSDLQELLNNTDPRDPNSNLNSLKNGGSTTNTDGGSTTQPITINLPGQNGGTTVTKNPDGSLTFNFPDGSKETVKPGDNSSHENPAGGSFVVNPDGTITFTDKDGNSYTVDPSKIGGQPTASDSKTTVIVLPGQTGTDGKPGANTIVTVEKAGDGSTILHLPDGTTKEVKPGDKGTLPNGTTYVVNDDGTITFTNPDGSHFTVDPKDGTQHDVNITTNGGNTDGTDKNTVVFVPNKDGNGGIIINVTKKPNGDIVITNPDGSTQTVKPGDKGTLPNGATFVVNPDGTITITNPDGSHFTIDPSKGASMSSSTNGGNTTTNTNSGNTTINNYYGSNGPASTTITLPAGKDGKTSTITYTKNPDGTLTLTLPDGSKTVKPGDTGSLPNGGSYVVNPDGSLTITDPDGSKSTITPGGSSTTNNGGTTNNYYGGSTTITLPADKDGKTSTITYTKNPDGTLTLTLPDGSKNVKPGDTGSLPNGGSYVVNPDGSLTITNPDGTKFTINPGTPTAANNGGTTNNTTNNYYYGTDGAKTTTIVLPAGSDGKSATITYSKNPDGTFTLVLPDGAKTVKPGDTGSLPNGGSYVVNPDGSLTITNPDGSKATIYPGNGNGSTGNVYVINNYYGSGDGSKSTVVVIPGKDGTSTTVTVTKNPDGTITFTTPGGDITGKPGDKGTLPDGTTYVINPDGTVTFTTKGGTTFTMDPSKGAGNANTVTVNVNVNDGSGSTSTTTTVNTPTGNYTVNQNGDGTYDITFPDGSTVNNVKPGDKGNVPGGGTYTVNDHNIVVTLPGGGSLTINFDNGGNGSTTPGGNTTTTTTTPGGNGGTTNPGGNTNTTTPGGNTGTSTDGGTGVVTTNTNTNTNTNNNGGDDGASTGTTTSTTTGAGVVTGEDQGSAGNGSNGSTSASATAKASSAGETDAASDADAVKSQDTKTSKDGQLPQTDENAAEGVAALGLLGGLISLLGLAGTKKRRKEL